MVFGYGIYLMAVHHVALHWHMELCREPMVPTVPVHYRLSFIGHNDAASYLVGYEGRSSYASICIHHWFGIKVQLHTLMGMKAGVHVH